jgi:hypothetical protein
MPSTGRAEGKHQQNHDDQDFGAHLN